MITGSVRMNRHGTGRSGGRRQKESKSGVAE